MCFSDLTPAELAFLVEDAYLADVSEFTSSVARNYELLPQLRAYLGGKPDLTGTVLALWLVSITSEKGRSPQLEAEQWFDAAILGVERTN